MTINTIPIISRKDTAPKTPPITVVNLFDVGDIGDVVPVSGLLKVIQN